MTTLNLIYSGNAEAGVKGGGGSEMDGEWDGRAGKWTGDNCRENINENC